MKEKFGIGGVAAVDNRSDFFPRFRPVPPPKSSRYVRVTYTPSGYYCEQWEYKPTSMENSATVIKPKVLQSSRQAVRSTELLIDLFFLICVGLFILTFLWAQGLLA